MNPDRMKERGANFSSVRSALLKDYQLKFNKMSKEKEGEGFANIVSSPGSVVEGVLYELEEEHLLILDKYENCPVSYRREIIEVVYENPRLLKAITYIANSDHISENLLPTHLYLGHLLKAKNFLSDPYYNFLKNHPTL